MGSDVDPGKFPAVAYSVFPSSYSRGSRQAALLGCTVDTVTLSVEQKQLTEERARAAGVDGRIRVHLCDYRELPPSFAHAFDACVSCEMVEVRRGFSL